MTSASDAFATPFEYRERLYPPLTMQSYGALERAVRQKAVDNTRAILRLNGVKDDQHYPHLVGLAQRLVTLGEVSLYVDTADGSLQVLRLSLEQSGLSTDEAEKIVSSIPAWDAIKLARRVSTMEQMFLEAVAEERARILAQQEEARARDAANQNQPQP